ncbi:hypothetical protein ACEWY4_001478 [Coilia grayii]|uniref:Transcription factor Adf-1-like n=1 Tax=Coilia grayii TaxID=363190 RepID=A0ABD1KT19_9TELE
MEERLITVISGFPILYDMSLSSYRDTSMKNEAWRKVAEIVGVPEQKCRDRWKSLRDSYVKEKKKEKERSRSGAGASSRPRWKFMAVMGFLAPFIEVRETTSNLPRRPVPAQTPPNPSPVRPPSPAVAGPLTPHAEAEGSEEEDQPSVHPPPSTEAPPLQQCHSPPSTTESSPSTSAPQPVGCAPLPNPPDSDDGPCRPRGRKRRGESLSVFERGLLEALRAPPTPAPAPAPAPPLQQGLTAADEDEVFFLSLLPTMRRLPPPKKAEVKFLIHKLLFEAERDSRE